MLDFITFIFFVSKSRYKFTYFSLGLSIYHVLHPLSSDFRIRCLRSWRQTVLKITQDMFKKPLLEISLAPLDQDIQVIEDTPYAVNVESCTHWIASQHNLSSVYVSYRQSQKVVEKTYQVPIRLEEDVVIPLVSMDGNGRHRHGRVPSVVLHFLQSGEGPYC